jgi:hypothetical protein
MLFILIPFSQVVCPASKCEEPLFFHPSDENMSLGTPVLAEKLRPPLIRGIRPL